MNEHVVLVTGGTGFVGAHCVVRLLTAGHRVRATVRSADRAERVRALVRAGGVDPAGALEVVVADLTADDGWAAALRGCTHVLHVASPYPVTPPRDENELLVPAPDGTLRVLRAARAAGIRRVVLTSSFAAIGYGHPHRDMPFTEADWTDPTGPHVGAYARSKTLAERAAWDFVEREPDAPELAVLNPVGIAGPVLGPDLSTSMLLLQRLLNRQIPALPRVAFSFVDVRDLADLQLRAMTDPAAAGARFLAAAGEPVWAVDLARLLRDRLGVRIPTRQAPNLVVRLASRLDRSLSVLRAELGAAKRTSADKARRVLGWQPRPTDESIVDGAISLVEFGLVDRVPRPAAATG
jgi:dihydroflavonol-4-reductase